MFLAWLKMAEWTADEFSPAVFIMLVLPLLSFGVGAILLAAVWGAKWTLLGRVKESQHHFGLAGAAVGTSFMCWGVWASRFLKAFEGCLALNVWLRAMGVRVGRNVLLGRGFSQVVDPDMLNFEDGATVTGLFQAHSFEDRVLKTAPAFGKCQCTLRLCTSLWC